MTICWTRGTHNVDPKIQVYFDGLVQDCSIPIANALKIPQPCTKPSSCSFLLIQGITHWGRVTHICVSKLTSIDSDNGLSPDRRQAIIWTSAGILLIGPLETNFNEILIEILTFSFKKMRLKVSSAKRRPSCLGLNVITGHNPINNMPTDQATSHYLKEWW